MITYNHCRFLAAAIEGVLAQTGPFVLRLVIGEDCSSDQTRAICERYSTSHPDRIVLLPSERNLGIQDNFMRTLRACAQSDYVAFCEGDDLWVDPNKIAHQVAFLQANSALLGHAHNVWIREVDTGADRAFGIQLDTVFPTIELFKGWPFHLVSLMARTDVLMSIPFGELPRFQSCDRFVNMWLACHGGVFYEGKRFSAVYHRHDFGASAASMTGMKKLSVLMEDAEVLAMLRNWIRNPEVYRLARSDLIQKIVYSQAVEGTRVTPNRFRLAWEYSGVTRLRRRSNFFYLLLILIGSSFLRAWEQRVRRKHGLGR